VQIGRYARVSATCAAARIDDGYSACEHCSGNGGEGPGSAPAVTILLDVFV
jgi:hypothetical protein